MKRLTKRYIDEDDGSKSIGVYTGGIIPEIFFENEKEYRAMDKLAEYEDLEEQGLLVRLPDDLNKVLYQVGYMWTPCTKCGEKYNECENTYCKCECDSRKKYDIAKVGLQYISIRNYYNCLGKSLFLTREEAEKKLEEIQNV